MIDFDYNKLNNLRIYELRDLARNVGVKSPTSLKKEEIIEQILLILSGENAPYVNTTKQGRPAKSQSSIDELVDFFVPKTNSFEQEKSGADYSTVSDERFEFIANAPNIEYNKNEKNEVIKGFLDIQKNGYGIIRTHCIKPSDDDVFLHLYSIKTYNLQTGDLLEGEVKLIQSGHPRVMINIISVNGLPLNALKNRVLFSSLPYNALNNPLQLSNSELLKKYNILEGSRNLIVSDNFYLNDLKKVIDALDKSSYDIYALHLNSLPEEKELEDKQIHFFSLPFNLEDKALIDCTNMFIEKAKREVENGKKVILVINHITSVLQALNHIESGTYSNSLTAGSINRFKEMIMCAKNVSSSNNLTLILTETKHLDPIVYNFIQYDFVRLLNLTIDFTK